MTDSITHITEVASSPAGVVSDILRHSFHETLAGIDHMDPAVYGVMGFCGKKFRLLLNNIVRSFAGEARYLEVGVFGGATLFAVLSNNKATVTAIDNWSWDRKGEVTPMFYKNMGNFKTSETKVSIIENAFENVEPACLGKYNIYFYDGDHSEKSQYDAMIWSMPALDETSIVLVDDWNWANVRAGTMKALRDAGVTIDYMLELRTSFDNTIPVPHGGQSDWHNGFFAAVISKAKAS